MVHKSLSHFIEISHFDMKLSLTDYLDFEIFITERNGILPNIYSSPVPVIDLSENCLGYYIERNINILVNNMNTIS